METEYEYNITNLEVKNIELEDGTVLENVIIKANWNKTARRGHDAACYAGASGFSAEGLTADGFIPYANLTQEQVIEWVVSGIDDYRMAHIDKCIEDQLNINRRVLMPWEPEPTDPIELEVMNAGKN